MTPDTTNDLASVWPLLATALGLGLLIGTVRERQSPGTLAGVRTHALAALLGAVAFWFSTTVFLLMLGLVIGLVLIGYWRSSTDDLGVTGEVALPLTALLGALALAQPWLAAGIGVVTAALLHAKASLHRFSKELLSEREVHDGLVLLASALVVLPLIPDRVIGPFAAFNPATAWRLVVLVMAINALGHVALRVIGGRWGLAVAGFFAGYVSSTAAVAGFGQRSRSNPATLRPAVAAALLANLASLTLFVPVLLAVSPALLSRLAPDLCAAALALLAGGLTGLGGRLSTTQMPTAESRVFRIGAALGFAAMIVGVLFIAAAMNAWLGAESALLVAMVAAAAELQAALATIGQLFNTGAISAQQAHWGLFAILATSSATKAVIAFVSGGRGYGLRVSGGLAFMLLATLATLAWIRYAT
jgi:uncharacterized membrane protein (DUF4010 family)